MAELLATMITTTTYGTWLPGDLRGYVEDGRVLPGSPEVLQQAERLMMDEAVLLSRADQDAALLGLRRGCDEFGYDLYAVSIEAWHAHALVGHGRDRVSDVVGRLKNRMRQAVGRGRIWTKGYDKRFCYTQRDVDNRMAYIRRHAGHRAI